MKPDYEVRLLLNPTAVLSPEQELRDTVLSTFEMPQTDKKTNVQFLDTSLKDLYTAGWSARIRKTENEADVELTYKKRYPITDDDIDTALTTANNDGFNAGDTKYEAQVEWGYQKQTLSISRKKTVEASANSGTDLPEISKSRQMMIKNAPDKFDNFMFKKWGTGKLAESRIFGPVLVSRSIGKWNGIKLYLEIWPLLNLKDPKYIVEASFKTKSLQTASIERSKLAAFLQSKNWLLAEDSLKTELIMKYL